VVECVKKGIETLRKAQEGKDAVIHVSFVLDETGSMESYKAATISGFNEYVDGLRGRDALFTLVTFNSMETKRRYEGVPIKDVKALTDETYKPDATTPLYDAIIAAVGATKPEEGNSVLFIIMTDGLENASKEATRDDVFKVIEGKKKDGWSFVFLGADQDAWAVGRSIGVFAGNTMSYASAETGETFSALCVATHCHVHRGAPSATTDFFTNPDFVAGDSGHWKSKEKS